MNLHALLSDNLLADPTASGRLHTIAVGNSVDLMQPVPLSFVDVSQSTYISSMLGVYELNRIELLRDVFVWAYKRSCARYSAVRQSLGDPDPFRLQHRQRIIHAVTHVVREKMSKLQAVSYIQFFAQEQIEPPDRGRFIELVETELLSLHEGNIARYRLRPSEFHIWYEVWKN